MSYHLNLSMHPTAPKITLTNPTKFSYLLWKPCIHFRLADEPRHRAALSGVPDVPSDLGRAQVRGQAVEAETLVSLHDRQECGS